MLCSGDVNDKGEPKFDKSVQFINQIRRINSAGIRQAQEKINFEQVHKRNKHKAAWTSGHEQINGMASEISFIRLDSQKSEQNCAVPIGVRQIRFLQSGWLFLLVAVFCKRRHYELLMACI